MSSSFEKCIVQKDITPSEQNAIHSIAKSTFALAVASPVVASVALKISGFKDFHASFSIIVAHLQVLMVPMQVNKHLFDNIQELFKFMGLFTLTPPFLLDLEKPVQVFLSYGYNLFPKLAGVLAAVILFGFLSRKNATCKGIRVLGADVLFNKSLVFRIALLGSVPIWFSLCSVSLNIQSATYGYVFSVCYVVWTAIVALTVLYFVITKWYEPLAKQFYSFGPTPVSRFSIRCGSSKEKEAKPKFAYYSTDVSRRQKVLFFKKIVVESGTEREEFLNDYGAIFDNYKAVHLDHNERSRLARLRRQLSHRFELINVLHYAIFTTVTVLLWETWIGLALIILQQATFILAIIILNPYRTWQLTITNVVSNIFLAIEFVILLFFNFHVKWHLLVIVASLALGQVITCLFVIPVFFVFLMHDSLPQLPPSSQPPRSSSPSPSPPSPIPSPPSSPPPSPTPSPPTSRSKEQNINATEKSPLLAGT